MRAVDEEELLIALEGAISYHIGEEVPAEFQALEEVVNVCNGASPEWLPCLYLTLKDGSQFRLDVVKVKEPEVVT